MADRLTRRDVLTKALGIEFKVAPCDRGCGAPRPDPEATKRLRAEIDAEVRRFQRIEANRLALEERQGAVALDVAAKATRWLSDGREQEGPAVKFFDPDGVHFGFYSPQDPYAISVVRGLSVPDLVHTVAHETYHWRCPWDPSEDAADRAAGWVFRRYFNLTSRPLQPHIAALVKAAYSESSRTRRSRPAT